MPQHTRAQLLGLLDTTRKISLDGLQEYFSIERSVFTLAGFGKPFEFTERDVEINTALRQVIEQEPGSDLTPALVAKIEPVLGEQFANSDRFAPEFDRILAMTKWSSLTLMLLGLALVFLGTAMLRRRVLLPLESATRLAGKIAQGDLTTHVEVRSSDEIGLLQSTLKSMNDNLADIAQQVRASGEGIANAAKEVVAGSNQLSQRTEHQASTLEQTAASMEELSVTTSNNLDQMRQAKTVAESAVIAANECGDAVKNAIESMGRVGEGSKRIADIVGVIDGIAFQTNILALNAAVEAARAGEQGRGFAVVAQEVRQLAQKSAAAAKEIKTLINDSLGVVDDSYLSISNAGDKMRVTVERIHFVSELVNQTELASAEQAGGIQQVNQAMAQLEEVTQHNAALVEQATAAAESQESQAYHLVELVSRFKLSNESANRAAAIAKVPQPAKVTSVTGAVGNVRGKTKAVEPSAMKNWPQEDKSDWQEF